jgi:asparagine synthase (glutamine-hydrolysing)
MRTVAGLAVDRLPRNETLKRGVRSLDIEDRLRRYQAVFSLSTKTTADALFIDGVLPEQDAHEPAEYWAALLPQMRYLDDLGGFQLIEIRSSLPDELLMYADKMSMAHGLEVRVPYLDRTVVEYVQRLDASLKIRNGTGKWLHRRVSRKYLPEKILNRRKRGFAVNVVDEWLRSSAEGNFGLPLLDADSFIFELLKPEAVRALLADHRTGRHDNHKLLFSLVMLEQWMRMFRSSHRPSRAH